MEESQEKDFMIIPKSKITILFLVLVGILWSCKQDDGQQVIPDVFVDIEINLDNQEYLPLRQDGGSVNIVGGVRGILLYHENGNYNAFERNCPYEPDEDCAKVVIDSSSLFIRCPCCGSQFNFEGGIISGPTILPLKEYATAQSGSYLRITN